MFYSGADKNILFTIDTDNSQYTTSSLKLYYFFYFMMCLQYDVIWKFCMTNFGHVFSNRALRFVTFELSADE